MSPEIESQSQFSRETTGLPEVTTTEVIELRDGDTFDLRAHAIRKRLGEETVKMLAYNGSIPGPTLRVPQGAEITVEFTNELDLDTTVHWHGLRLDNRFDGVAEGHHRGMQPPIPPGGSFTYRLRVPDVGAYWYHPHIREDYGQEHGLYGNIIVEPATEDYWSPVNRELTLTVDDILIEEDKVAPFSREKAAKKSRFGNVMLLNGETEYALGADEGEVIRFYLTNTANARNFTVRIPDARIKYVGDDNGRVEHEKFVDHLVMSPSERIIVDVLFEHAGEYVIEHQSSTHTYTLGTIDVREQSPAVSFAEEFSILRSDVELEAERRRLHDEDEFDRKPDKTLALVGEMPGMKHGNHAGATDHGNAMASHGHGHGHGHHGGADWKIVDRETGAVNMDIDWTFDIGDRVKIRIVNDPDADHVMAHPFHFHGECFLVLASDGVPNENLVWKDTVLVNENEIVDVLLDISNPGLWMAHCHIAEHSENGMMFNFQVNERGDDERRSHDE
ncbi:MAG TPA: multicopper oxidase family protein [Halococcus sp.]|nr:multicopper oxidase family protein [Halococcus sp.]